MVVANRVLLSMQGPQGRLEVLLTPGTNGHSGQPAYQVRLNDLRMTAVSLAEAYALAAKLMAGVRPQPTATPTRRPTP